ncbi:hypothetical protein AMTRI_Chr04g246970 [Amborella trichopoda]
MNFLHFSRPIFMLLPVISTLNAGSIKYDFLLIVKTRRSVVVMILLPTNFEFLDMLYCLIIFLFSCLLPLIMLLHLLLRNSHAFLRSLLLHIPCKLKVKIGGST